MGSCESHDHCRNWTIKLKKTMIHLENTLSLSGSIGESNSALQGEMHITYGATKGQRTQIQEMTKLEWLDG